MKEIIFYSSDKPNRLKELCLTIDLTFIGVGFHGWDSWSWKDRNFCFGIRFFIFDLTYLSYKMN